MIEFTGNCAEALDRNKQQTFRKYLRPPPRNTSPRGAPHTLRNTVLEVPIVVVVYFSIPLKSIRLLGDASLPCIRGCPSIFSIPLLGAFQFFRLVKCVLVRPEGCNDNNRKYSPLNKESAKFVPSRDAIGDIECLPIR